jgi:starch synthase
MACGLPVVATDAPGIADVLPRGEDSGGLVVACEDAGALAEALGRLIASPAEASRLGARGRREIERRFSYATVGQALESVLFGGDQERP